MLIAALAVYARATLKPKYGMVVFAFTAGAFLIAGQAAGSALPHQAALIVSWLAAPAVLASIAGWIDRRA